MRIKEKDKHYGKGYWQEGEFISRDTRSSPKMTPNIVAESTAEDAATVASKFYLSRYSA